MSAGAARGSELRKRASEPAGGSVQQQRKPAMIIQRPVLPGQASAAAVPISAAGASGGPPMARPPEAVSDAAGGRAALGTSAVAEWRLAPSLIIMVPATTEGIACPMQPKDCQDRRYYVYANGVTGEIHLGKDKTVVTLRYTSATDTVYMRPAGFPQRTWRVVLRDLRFPELEYDATNPTVVFGMGRPYEVTIWIVGAEDGPWTFYVTLGYHKDDILTLTHALHMEPIYRQREGARRDEALRQLELRVNEHTLQSVRTNLATVGATSGFVPLVQMIHTGLTKVVDMLEKDKANSTEINQKTLTCLNAVMPALGEVQKRLQTTDSRMDGMAAKIADLGASNDVMRHKIEQQNSALLTLQNSMTLLSDALMNKMLTQGTQDSAAGGSAAPVAQRTVPDYRDENEGHRAVDIVGADSLLGKGDMLRSIRSNRDGPSAFAVIPRDSHGAAGGTGEVEEISVDVEDDD